MHKQLILSSFILIISFATVEDFRFSRSLECVDKNTTHLSCLKWNQTTTLYRYSELYYYCFPGQTYVLTPEGPKQMQQLKLTDLIFSYDPQTQKKDFVSIKAWLHYDANSLFRYNQISVQNSTDYFYISGYHNVGYISQNDKYQFKFAKDLKNGDKLISFTKNQKNFFVKNNILGDQKKGLFSPMTQTGTLYIFSNSQQQLDSGLIQIQSLPLILVHSLSQIHNPMENFNKAANFMSLYSLFANQYEPNEEDQYVNPLISQFSFIFNNDWQKAKGIKILHRYSSYTSSTYSNEQSRQREQRKRKTMAVLALNSILKDTMI